MVHRSEPGEVFRTESPRHTSVQQGLPVVTPVFNKRTFRLGGAVFRSYSSGSNHLRHAHMSRMHASFDFEREVSVFVDNAAEVEVYISGQLLRSRGVKQGMAGPVFVGESFPSTFPKP